MEVSTKLDYFDGSFLYILGLFKVKIHTKWEYIWYRKISSIFWVCLIPFLG